jgi:hypothetical protein
VNPVRRGGKPATNRLSYGAASVAIPTLLSRLFFGEGGGLKK